MAICPPRLRASVYYGYLIIVSYLGMDVPDNACIIHRKHKLAAIYRLDDVLLEIFSLRLPMLL
jgi:hypothetical protein